MKKEKYVINILVVIIFLCALYIINNKKSSSELLYKSNELKIELANIAEVSVRDNKDIKKLKEINEDIIGWINIPNTIIDYPIVQGVDNTYYLDKNTKKEQAKEGSIFLDSLNDSSFNDKNNILYGHNMAGDIMFGGLRFYRDQDYLDKHPLIKIYTENEIREYEIFSVYVTNAEYDYRTKLFNETNTFDSFLKRISEPSLINRNIDIGSEDKILTLSTCAFDFDNARLAIHAKLKSIEDNKSS